MKDDLTCVWKYRQASDEEGGWFLIPIRGKMMKVIASWGEDWDHVSVSMKGRTPNWEEMCEIKDLFFEPEECVIQFHPPQSKYINIHPYALHLWRPQNVTIPMPPLELV